MLLRRNTVVFSVKGDKMTYFVSDLHGEYELFCSLLKKINFNENDVMYVCGDVLEKGDSSLKLLKLICSLDNVRCVIGNHDRNFLKFYHTIMEKSPSDFDAVLDSLREFFLDEDKELLTWDMVDYLDSLPYFIEEDDFICVHAGVPIDGNGFIAQLDKVDENFFIFDRRFKDADFVHKSEKCVFFGHTVTDNAKIITYKRHVCQGKSIRDYYKIHLDTGAWQNGVLGCFCLESCDCVYVKK